MVLNATETHGHAMAFTFCPTYNAVHSKERLNLGDKVSSGQRAGDGAKTIGILDKVFFRLVINCFISFNLSAGLNKKAIGASVNCSTCRTKCFLNPTNDALNLTEAVKII